MNQALPQPQESVLALAPLTVRRTVRWSECDPAGVVYAGKFPDYMINTVSQFRTHVAGVLVGPNPDQDYHTPGKGLEMAFISPLWPNDVFDMAVHFYGAGRSTVHLLVAATRADDGRPVFAGRVTSIHVDARDRMRAVPVTDAMRRLYHDYAKRCGPMPDFLNQVAFAAQPREV